MNYKPTEMDWLLFTFIIIYVIGMFNFDFGRQLFIILFYSVLLLILYIKDVR